MPATTLSPHGLDSAVESAEAVRVVVNGSRLGEEWLGMLMEAQVRDNLLAPDMAVLKFTDPLGEKMSSNPLTLGVTLEVWFGAAAETQPTKVFSGEVVALEPEFREDGAFLVVRAFDKGHRLNRTKESRTYVQVKAEDIVRQAAGRAGLSAGTIDATKVVHAHLIQNQETDWALCTRLAQMNGYTFGVTDGKLVFRRPAPAGAPVSLTWQENLTRFRPRISAVGQLQTVKVNSNDPKAAAQTAGTASRATARIPPALFSKRAKAIGAMSGGEVTIADRVAASGAEASAMAQAALDRNASAFFEADGVAYGSPKLTAGATVRLANVNDYDGEYVLSSTTHVYKGGTGYSTRFEITGDRPHSFAALAGGGGASAGESGGGNKTPWASSLVLAIVTSNNDPEKMGRIKVKYDALGANIESDWARVVLPHAGAAGGAWFSPQPGDQVVVGFEHGDARRPFVLGSLYTGKAKPDPELSNADKAKFGLKTSDQLLAHSGKELKLASDEKMTVEIKGNPGEYTLTADGDISETSKKNFKASASQNIELSANSSVKIKGSGTVEVESSGQLKVKGSVISVEASGVLELKGSIIKLG